jgi:CRP/FNR family transcriptional regulator, cyclic AMP receptor protein
MADSDVTRPSRAAWPEERVALLDAVAELGSSLTGEDRAALERVTVPVVTVPKGQLQLDVLLARHDAVAAVVVDGLVLQALHVGQEPGLRILGPGEVVAAPSSHAPEILDSSTYRTRGATQLAVLGREFLAAACHVPRLFVGLQRANAAQVERLAAQLVICQLSRVADRVHAMLWLLADSYGRVTPAGTRLPMSLTHEVLGALVGARRPTVTLALGDLSERGVLAPQDGGWLLLKPWVAEPADKRVFEHPELLDLEPSGWAEIDGALFSSSAGLSTPERFAELTATVSRLRDQHREHVLEVRERLTRIARSRERTSEALRRIRAERGVSRRPNPSA